MRETANRVEFLDHIRGAAIIAVFLHHCGGAALGHFEPPWDGWFADTSFLKPFLPFFILGMGQCGVSIFFVVSGFCIHTSFIQQGGGWRNFWIRRFFRIYPPFLCALLLFTFLIPIKDWFFSSETSQFFRHLMLVHNFDKQAFYGINPSFWSIAVEVQLYLLYPVVFLLGKWFGWRKTLAITGAIEILIRGASAALNTAICAGCHLPPVIFQINPALEWLTVSPLSFWFSWSVGAAIAEAWHNKQPLPFRRLSPWLWLGLAVVCSFTRPVEPFAFLCFAIFTATVISRTLAGQRVIKMPPRFLSEHIRKVGVWSYSLYLLHQPLIMLFRNGAVLLFPPANNHPWVIFAFCVSLWPLILALGGLWFRLVEKPSAVFGKKFTTR